MVENKDTYVICGVFSAIGERLAIDLNSMGCKIIGIGHSEKKKGNLIKKLKYPENLDIEISDFSQNIENLSSYIKNLSNKYGKFKGLIYCAGVSSIKPLSMINLNDMQKAMNINFLAPLFLAQGFASKGVYESDSSIVVISSAAALQNNKGQITYSASKAALNSAFISIGKELIRKKIRVNIVSPTDIKTPMHEELNQYRFFDESKYPMGVGAPEDVSNFIMFLLSEKAKWLNCQNYIIDCGSM